MWGQRGSFSAHVERGAKTVMNGKQPTPQRRGAFPASPLQRRRRVEGNEERPRELRAYIIPKAKITLGMQGRLRFCMTWRCQPGRRRKEGNQPTSCSAGERSERSPERSPPLQRRRPRSGAPVNIIPKAKINYIGHAGSASACMTWRCQPGRRRNGTETNVVTARAKPARAKPARRGRINRFSSTMRCMQDKTDKTSKQRKLPRMATAQDGPANSAAPQEAKETNELSCASGQRAAAGTRAAARCSVGWFVRRGAHRR